MLTVADSWVQGIWAKLDEVGVDWTSDNGWD